MIGMIYCNQYKDVFDFNDSYELIKRKMRPHFLSSIAGIVLLLLVPNLLQMIISFWKKKTGCHKGGRHILKPQGPRQKQQLLQ